MMEANSVQNMTEHLKVSRFITFEHVWSASYPLYSRLQFQYLRRSDSQKIHYGGQLSSEYD